MKILLITAVLVALLLVGVVVWMGMPKGPDLEEVAHLRTPQILESQLRETLRISKPTEVPESMKRAPR